MAAARLTNLLQQTITLPSELVDHIMSFVPQAALAAPVTAPTTTLANHRAAVPRTDDSCPLMKLPAELRRQIFMDSLPERDQIILPTCGHALQVPMATKKSHKTNNRLVNLMTLNKTICQEVSEMVYEERFFKVHVHAGFQNAGVEWLNAGRQPLQYQDEITDGRFARFTPKEVFGFQRVKKITVSIFPSAVNRHAALNTYFMNLALVRMLREGKPDERDKRMSFIEINLCHGNVDGVQDPLADYWWDAATDRPRESSVHGISDAELALRPFAGLTGAQRAKIVLPPKLQKHGPTVAFADRLFEHMTHPERQCLVDNDEIGFQIETARLALEDYISKTCFGGTWVDVPRLTEEELAPEDGQMEEEDRVADPEKKMGWLRQLSKMGNRKHGHSPEKPNAGGAKRKKIVLKLRGPVGKKHLADIEADEAIVNTIKAESLGAGTQCASSGMHHGRQDYNHQPGHSAHDMRTPRAHFLSNDPRIRGWQTFADHDSRKDSGGATDSAFKGKGRTLGDQRTYTTRYSSARNDDEDVDATEKAMIEQALAESLQIAHSAPGTASAPISIPDDANEWLPNGHTDSSANYTSFEHDQILAQDPQIADVAWSTGVTCSVAQTYLEVLNWDVQAVIKTYHEQPGVLQQLLRTHSSTSHHQQAPMAVPDCSKDTGNEKQEMGDDHQADEETAIERADIDLVAQHTGVSHSDAQVYLEFFGGDVDAIIKTYDDEPELLSQLLVASSYGHSDQLPAAAQDWWTGASQDQLNGIEDPFDENSCGQSNTGASGQQRKFMQQLQAHSQAAPARHLQWNDLKQDHALSAEEQIYIRYPQNQPLSGQEHGAPSSQDSYVDPGLHDRMRSTQEQEASEALLSMSSQNSYVDPRLQGPVLSAMRPHRDVKEDAEGEGEDWLNSVV